MSFCYSTQKHFEKKYEIWYLKNHPRFPVRITRIKINKFDCNYHTILIESITFIHLSIYNDRPSLKLFRKSVIHVYLKHKWNLVILETAHASRLQTPKVKYAFMTLHKWHLIVNYMNTLIVQLLIRTINLITNPSALLCTVIYCNCLKKMYRKMSNILGICKVHLFLC